MKPFCFLVGVFAVVCVFASCSYDDGTTTPYTHTGSTSSVYYSGGSCGRMCSPLGVHCAACSSQTRNCAPTARVRTRTDQYVGVSRYPSTWGAPETMTVTVSTCTWMSPPCASCGVVPVRAPNGRR